MLMQTHGRFGAAKRASFAYPDERAIPVGLQPSAAALPCRMPALDRGDA
ncbi:hypothetical protein SAMN05445871_2339 [Paraburkholderia caballeronis]|uniref:Uncharacterized protein n=1 Tax=Paraburkholderia caballeronis TaxID=416943 RepID=A0A1H7U2Y6_9BURK|nr:hypothetical protein C7403_110221 [Paraburkholderia caballeronis]PXW98475.1 hypothetical protein C7407_110221 [Paraburkholderia caballeronis]RAJ95206.1 hypothetical protein C7409_110222 [Paraburkholderia caballeronis]SEC50868.1 hypothetical protein SAMN05445871_2339 [Paraburkholderia caballeronis]SEL91341.1 hypothetical protein SAMN05192542_117111 [Paraburkholderia caballeronis]